VTKGFLKDLALGLKVAPPCHLILNSRLTAEPKRSINHRSGTVANNNGRAARD
jgi:hypothetical protein